MAVVTVKSGHVRPLWAGHPWVYAQAVLRVRGGAVAGDEVEVQDERGNALGLGLYSPGSAIVVRLYSRDPKTRLDAEFFRGRVRGAAERRRGLGLPSEATTGYRLIHAEGDDLPGLIVDRFGDCAVMQIGTTGIKRREAAILDAVMHATGVRTVIDRTTERAAKAEGFAAGSGIVRGDALSELSFSERGLRFRIPLELGHKTGFYLDQRPLRDRVEALSRGKSVLDTFSYVGSFALGAARGGAERVQAVDSSALALEVAAECARDNQLTQRIHFERGDAHEALAQAGRQGGYDLVICDPPKLAPSRAAQKKALSAMRRLAAAGARATRPGGLLVICSCSAAIGLDPLTRAVALGSRDVGLRAVVLERWFQGADHPVPAAFPEGLYLSSLIVQVSPL